MRELLLLRHAQTNHREADQDDLDRSLTTHGKTQASAVGRYIATHDLLPEHVLCSPAKRTRNTLAGVLAELSGDLPQVHYLDGIYQATAGELISLMDDARYKETRVLLIGHNPGIEHVIALLCDGQSDSFRGVPSATLAHIALTDPVEPGHGKLLDFQTF